MSDDLNQKGPADRNRINVSEPWEVRYWTRELNCTEQQLREAVRAVGVMVVDVRRYLSQRR